MQPSAEQRDEFAEQGFTLLHGFANEPLCKRMLDDVVDLCRRAAGAGEVDGALVLPESNLAQEHTGRAGQHAKRAEQMVSKVFRLHRRPVFRDFVERTDVLRSIGALLGPHPAPRLDCFLSQFIFKNPGAWGQPWHQDSFYFPFDRAPQIGLWLAVTEATLENGCLHVVPGSHHEPIHEHVPDRRPGANYGYVEIVDHDMSSAVPVGMAPGDVLLFHSHLMHASTDNESDDIRAAMVFHFAESGTRVLSERDSPVNDWMPLPDPAAARSNTSKL